jgi:hypothetical protein
MTSSVTKRGAGGTTGGIGKFFLGVALMGIGVWLFLGRVKVMSNWSSMWGGHTGLLLLPLAAGVALLFRSGKSVLGWLLTLGATGLVLVAIISNLTLFFSPTGLLETTAMLALMFSGLFMTLRSLRPH